MIDRLPPDVLSTVAERAVSDLRGLGLVCHSLAASLRSVRPPLSLCTSRPEVAHAVESGGMWRVTSVTIFEDAVTASIAGGAGSWDPCTCASQAACEPVEAASSKLSAWQLEMLATFETLACVQLDRCDVDDDGLAALSAAPQLAVLRLRQLKVSSLAPLARFPSLCVLDLASCWRVDDLAPLAACPPLSSLSLTHFKGAALPPCPSLREVSVANAPALTSLWEMGACARLARLSLAVCHVLRDLSPLADCAALTEITLDRCTGLRDVTPLAACASLHELTLSRCPGITSLAALATCAELRRLDVVDCSGLTHFAAPCRVARALVRLRAACPPRV